MTVSRRRRGVGLLLAAAGLLGAAMPAPGAETCLRGVNLSGAEFGTVPGRPNTDYTYPAEAAIRRLAGLGMTSFRLPFRWERIQPKLGDELDAAELARLDQSIDTAKGAGLVAILDLHNFGYYAGKRLGAPTLPASALGDVWRRLATHYRDRTNVVFSIMNEPYDIHSAEWAKIQNVAIAAIRKAGAKQLLLVTGTAYGGAHSWTSDLPVGNNGRDLLAIEDPLKRFAYDFHQYLDADYSGRQPECTAAQGALKAIDDVGAWLKAHGRQGFLGEFAASDRPECVMAFKQMIGRLDSRPEQWIGWTAWGAGPWWPPDYVFNLEPTAAGERPQTKALIEQLKSSGPRNAMCGRKSRP
ncbi:glycoside hydrolase family 5 protein [Bosea psychrotolerans]|uniref:Cellulase (Glycosyl hydrolase family 5) n=1 Tax=Bosea psychrotolerans TaxID=1871628 RepID=A0A2S4M8E2_9HYPH|nr:glycoside hydrolase family 5 protein [Bosea psychrotolerans]POR50885.1 cellulase (glycosyl hydrolase family 5) [Bosea psychrotolerans]